MENMPIVHFLLKWLHVFFGIIWIGILYYFNYVQGAFLAQADAGTKSQVTQKLLPINMWWFRWGAMWTFVTGLLMLHTAGFTGYSVMSPWGPKILTGALLGTFMWANVWFIIWPAQKVIIASAEAAAKGGQADPRVALLAPKAGLASRTNTLFSIPMLFFMLGGAHLPIEMDMSKSGTYYLAMILVVGALELNAIKGKTGPLTTVKGVITCGFALTAVLFGLLCTLM
jgi:uncharacterized membrane protein